MKNYLSIENIKSTSDDSLLGVIQSSSEMEGCPITNVLEPDEKTLWLSTEELPQEITINIKKDLFKEIPTKISAIGIYCWHAYPTNPKLIEIQISKNSGITFISLGNFDLCLKPGKQLLQFDYELNPSFIKEKKVDIIIKLIIKETFGDKRTYINNIFLYENINIGQKTLITNMEPIKEEDSNSMIYLRESRERTRTKDIKEMNTIEENKENIKSEDSYSLISDSDLIEKYNKKNDNKDNELNNEIKNDSIKNNDRYMNDNNENENEILMEMNKQINLMLEKDEIKDIQQDNELSSKEKSLNINDFNNDEENENEDGNDKEDIKKEMDVNNSLNDIINEENLNILIEEFENYKRNQEKRMIEYENKIKNLEMQFKEMTFLNNKMKDTLDTLLESQMIQQNNNPEYILNNMKDIIYYKINNVFNNFNQYPNYYYNQPYNNMMNNYFNNNQMDIYSTERKKNKNEKELLMNKINLSNRKINFEHYTTEVNYQNNYNKNNLNKITQNEYKNYPFQIKQNPINNKNKKMNDLNFKIDKNNKSFQKSLKKKNKDNI